MLLTYMLLTDRQLISSQLRHTYHMHAIYIPGPGTRSNGSRIRDPSCRWTSHQLHEDVHPYDVVRIVLKHLPYVRKHLLFLLQQTGHS